MAMYIKGKDGVAAKVVFADSVLPHEYQEVEYIESNGTQYIDTGFYPTPKIKFCADLYFDYTNDKLSSTTAGFMGISADFSINFGSADNQKQQVFFWLNGYNNDNANSNATTSYVPQNTKTYFELNAKNRTYVCGIRSGNVLTEKTTDSKYSACLFGYKKSADNYAAIHPFTFFPMRLYTCKFYDDDKLVRNFVPCYSKINGTIGLYDLVEGKFHSNQGTGVFVKGNDTNVVTETLKGQLKKYRIARGIPNPNNLFDKSKITVIGSEFDQCSEKYLSEDKNVIIAKGNVSESTSEYAWSKGWVSPTLTQTKAGTAGISGLAGEKITFSADITLLEYGGFSKKILTHVGNGPTGKVYMAVEISPVKKRYSWTHTLTRDAMIYPIFCLNSNRVRIENIYINKGDTAEPFYSGIETI